MENIISQLTQLFRFLRRPYYSFPHHQTFFTNKIAQLIGFGILMIVADALLIPFINLIEVSSKIQTPNSSAFENWVKTLCIVTFVFPFFEELLFRFHLKSLKGSLFFYVALTTTLLISIMVKFMPHRNIAIFIFILLCFVLVIVAVILITSNNQYRYRSFFIRYFPYHIWFSAFIFAMIHLFNNSYHTSMAIVLSPLLVIPQFFGGMVLSYARLKYGIFSSMFIHGFHNLIVTVILYFLR